MVRSEEREIFSDKINSLTKSQLWEMGISRVSDVTGLDVIGSYTYSSVRPLSINISVNSGKSLNPRMARAGAILESAEYYAGECPSGETIESSVSQLGYPKIDCFSLPLISHSIFHQDMVIEWEVATEIVSGSNRLVPSEICWLVPRGNKFIAHFQNSSNGVASGCSIPDAICSGIYEIIERDARTISEYCESNKRVVNIPDSIQELKNKATKSGLRVGLFSCTQEDIGIPVFGCVVYGDEAGVYAGHGCHIDPVKSMERAVLEAYQSRCVFISGSRDDLFRRSFLVARNTSPKKIDDLMNGMPEDLNEYVSPKEMETSDEMKSISKSVIDAGFKEIYVKHLKTIEVGDNAIPVVKVFVPGMESIRMDGIWSPSPRCLKKKSLYTSGQA